MEYEQITTEDWIEYKKNATKYLEMHTQYATRKAIQIAIDKQIPKYKLTLPPQALFTLCPVCEKGVITKAMNYCPKCGDKLEWEV